MPRGNGTGPAGLGPMTGRAAGYCAGYGTPGFANPIGRRGGMGMGMGLGRLGGGRGRGRGLGNLYYANAYNTVPWNPPAITADQEIAALKDQAKYMQDSLNAINVRIQELSDPGSQKP